MLDAYLDAYRGLPVSVWKISFVLLINRCGTMVLPFWALYCTSERGLSVGEAGFLLAVHGVGGIFGSMLGGVLSSRIGPVRVMVGSLGLNAVAFLGLLWPTTLPGMAVAMFALSIVSEAARPAAATATASCCPRRLHPRAMGLNRLAVNLGMAIGPVIGGLLATVSFHLLFLCDAATCALAATASAWLLNNLEWESEEADEAPHASRLGLFTDLPLWIVLSMMLLTAVVFFQLMSTYVLFLHDHYALREYHIGILMGVNTVVIVLCEMALVRYVERFNQLRVIAWGCFFACAGFGMIQLGSSFAFAVLSVLVWTLGEMLSAPLTMAFVSARASAENRGLYLGMFTTCFSIAAVVAPLWGTWMYGRSPALLWNSCLIIGLVTLTVLWMLSRWVTPAHVPPPPLVKSS